MTRGEAVGLLEDAPSDFNARWDRRENARHVDLGSIGEDAHGIFCRRHPEVILLDESPHLVASLDAFQAGQVELTERDWAELAAPAYDAKLILRDAWLRSQTKGK